MVITTTRCQRGWPRTYRTYFQELEPPYRRAERVRVLRLGKLGLVWGRWTGKAEDERQALMDGLGAREVDVLDQEHQVLLPNFRKEP
ncbi:hypothetical protein ACFVGM_08970 [Kitasatospora purpeofusca]|uniref:hypothetical protein n=1 Tax=Kitasatospora purpeofusca TaxID=67352 RepID=UPI0036BEC694